MRLADEAYPIGPAPPRESYLRIDRVLDAARQSGADAVHPGYGFLAENADFARACEDAGLAFIGPRSEAIALMGEKTAGPPGGRGRRRAGGAGHRTPLGDDVPDDDVRREADAHRLPADAEGGRRRRRQGHAAGRRPDELAGALRARALARPGPPSATTASTWRRPLLRPRHIEIQVLGDQHGTSCTSSSASARSSAGTRR